MSAVVLALSSPHPALAQSDVLRAAAEGGDAAAQYEFAVRLDAGEGAARDRKAARAWYARAAARGDPRARYVLGQLFETGDGLPRNVGLARAWYAAAAPDVHSAAARVDALVVEPTAEPAKPALLTLGPSAAGALDVAWASPEQPAGTVFFLEVLAADGSTPLHAGFHALSAVSIALPEGTAPCCARAHAVVPAAASYRASDWWLLGARSAEAPRAAPPAEVAIASGGPGAAALADELAGDLRASGIRVETVPDTAAVPAPAPVVYRYAEDRAAAAAVAALLPGLPAAPAFVPPGSAPLPRPGRVEVSLKAPPERP